MIVKDSAVHRECAGSFSRASACLLRRPFSPSQQRHALCSHRDAGYDDRHSKGPGWTADGRSGGILDRRSLHFPSSILVSLNEKTSAGIVAIALTACFDRRIIFCKVSLSPDPAVNPALDLFELLSCPVDRKSTRLNSSH